MKSVFLLALMWSFIITSCQGQKPTRDEQKESIYKGTDDHQNAAPNYVSSVPLVTIKKPVDQVVRMMYQDSKGRIWFGAESGAFKLSDDTLVYVEGIKSESGSRVTIKDITEDKDGNIWLGHSDGISQLKGDSIVNYYTSDGLISHDVWCIEADSKGNIWIGTIAGVCIYDGKNFSYFPLPEGIKDTTMGVSSTRMIHDILEDNDGTIWISSNAGLFSYSDKRLTHVSEKAGISTNFVNFLFQDALGQLWISAKDGLYQLTGHKAQNIIRGHIQMDKGIGSMAEDKEGTIWFVANQHDLYTYDGQKVRKFQKPEENKGPVVFQIYKDQKERLWFVGFGGAYRLENGEFLHITKDGPW